MKDNFQIIESNLSQSFCGAECFAMDGYNNFSLKDIFGKKDEVPNPFGEAQFKIDAGDAPSSSGGGKVSPDAILSSLESGVELVKLFGTKRQLTEVENVCGKQPRPILFGKRKKERWAKCASEYVATKKAPAPSTGLSTGAIIGIVGGGIVLIGGIVLLIVKMKPKTVVVQAPPVVPIVS